MKKILILPVFATAIIMFVLILSSSSMVQNNAFATTPTDLGTAGNYVILSGNSAGVITNGVPGQLIARGNVGHTSTETAPFTFAAGFGDVSSGTILGTTTTLGTPIGDAHAAYVNIGTYIGGASTGLACNFAYPPGATNLSINTHFQQSGHLGQFKPGVYCVDGAAVIGAAGININATGPVIFKINGALTTVAGSTVRFNGTATSNNEAGNLYFATSSLSNGGANVGAFTSGASSQFSGTVLTGSTAITTGANSNMTNARFISESAITIGGGANLFSIPPVTTGTTVPATPTGVTATAISSSKIVISWTASPGATWYQVFSSTSSSGPFTLVGGTAGTPLTNHGLSPSTTYYYEVRASNTGGASALSSPPVSATTKPAPPATPTGVTATATSSSKIVISWTASPGATWYQVFSSTSSSGPFTLVGGTAGTPLTNHGLSPSTTYYYEVRASNTGGASALSSPPVSATTGNSGQCITPPSNLIGWWPADGNTNDLAGSHTGTISGGVTFALGKVAQAFSFDGTGSVGVGSLGISNNNQPFSMIAWLNPSASAINDGLVHTIAAEGSTPNNSGNGEFMTHFDIIGSNGLGQLEIEIGVTQTSSAIKFTAPVIHPGQWTLVAVTYDGSRTASGIKIYVNGVQQPDTIVRNDMGSASPRDEWTIGSQTVSGGYDLFAGLIDETEIFNRVITQQEIQSEFNADSAGKCKPSSSHVFFQDNYSSSTGWTQVGSSVSVNSPSFPGVASFNNAADGSDQRVYKQIASTLPTNGWIADFDYKFTSSSIPAAYPLALTTSSVNPEQQPPGDAILVYHGNNVDQLHLRVWLGSSVFDTPAFGTTAILISPNTQYFVRLDRTPTQLELSVFSDSARTIQISGSPLTFNIAPTDLANLNFVQHSTSLVSGDARTLTAQVDNLKIYNNDHTQSVIATIPVGNAPTGVAINPNTNTVYVANEAGGTASVINGNTNTVTATIPLGVFPFGIGVNPNTNTVYIENGGSFTLSVINGNTNTVTATLSTLGYARYGVAVNPNTNTVYVTSNSNNLLYVLNGNTNTVTATVPVGSDPSQVAVNPSTNTIYVANFLDNTVSVINGNTNTVTATVPVGSIPYGMAVNPNTNTIYVPNSGGTTVSVLDGNTNTVTATIPVGSNPSQVAVNPNTNTVYVSNSGGTTLSVINGNTNTVTATVSVGTSPEGIAINTLTNTIYVAIGGSNTVAVIR